MLLDPQKFATGTVYLYAIIITKCPNNESHKRGQVVTFVRQSSFKAPSPPVKLDSTCPDNSFD